jgi:hypothetical protein
MKLCTKCKVEQPIENFDLISKGKTRFRSMCRECSLAAGREWASKNRNKTRANAKKWRDRNPS